MKRPLWWIKLTNYEYWPFMVLYFPVSFYWTWLIIKSRSLTFFTLANPIEEYGGFFGESKVMALSKIDRKYIPRSFLIKLGATAKEVIERASEAGIGFPFFVKPNWGERGVNVEKISNKDQLAAYLASTDRDSIVQEYIDYPIELGVFYHRYPDGSSSGITGIVIKDLLTVTGDGSSTILELMERSDRARFQIERLKRYHPEMSSKILANGERFILEHVGNHNRGTMFSNGSHLITPELVKAFDEIAGPIKGFYYGRFDVKIRDYDSMYKGEGIKVLELNGVYSEPAHIYDPNGKLLDAYKEILRHVKLIYELSAINRKRGFRPSPASHFVKMVWRNYFKNKQVV